MVRSDSSSNSLTHKVSNLRTSANLESGGHHQARTADGLRTLDFGLFGSIFAHQHAHQRHDDWTAFGVR